MNKLNIQGFIQAVFLMPVFEKKLSFECYILWQMITKLSYNEGGGMEVL